MPVKTEKEVSAGGVVFRKDDERIQLVLISPKKGRWCLPKGLIGENEKEEETALREVREETGLNCRILEKIDTIEYWYFDKERDLRLHKFVHFFLMEYISGSTENHDWEVIEVKWFEREEAIQKASFESERNVLRKALKLIEKLR
ncbi:MAG: NUDIX hydrolase [Candidatus Aminicenantia bacterium]